jgi:hypothetical protein
MSRKHETENFRDYYISVPVPTYLSVVTKMKSFPFVSNLSSQRLLSCCTIFVVKHLFVIPMSDLIN